MKTQKELSPSTLALLFAKATTLAELQALKAQHGPALSKLAWSTLPQEQKERLTLLARISQEPAPAPIATQTPQEPAPAPIPKLPKLWELTDEINQIDDAICLAMDSEELDDVQKDNLTTVLFGAYLAAEENWDEKAINTALFIKHREAIADAQEKEAKRLFALAKVNRGVADSTRAYLLSEMVRLGKKTVKAIKATLTARKKPPRVIVECEPQELPPELVKVTYEPRLTKIKEVLKDNPESLKDLASFSTIEEHSLMIK